MLEPVSVPARVPIQLRALNTPYRIALTHYAPIEETLTGERPEVRLIEPLRPGDEQHAQRTGRAVAT